MHPTPSTTTGTISRISQNVEPIKGTQHAELAEKSSEEAMSPLATATTSSETFEQIQQRENEARQRIENEIKKQNELWEAGITKERINKHRECFMGKFQTSLENILAHIIMGQGESVREQLDTDQSKFEERNNNEEKALLMQLNKVLIASAEAPACYDTFLELCRELRYTDFPAFFEAMLASFIEEYTQEVKAISQQHVDDIVATYKECSNEQKDNQIPLIIDLPEDPEEIQEIISRELNTGCSNKVAILLKNPAQMAILSQSLINTDSIKELTLDFNLKESHNSRTFEQAVLDILTYYEALEAVFKKCPNATTITLSPAFPEYAAYESISLDALVTRTEDMPALQQIVFKAPSSYQGREDVQDWLPGMKESHSKFISRF